MGCKITYIHTYMHACMHACMHTYSIYHSLWQRPLEIDEFLPSVQIKRLFNKGKFLSSEERSGLCKRHVPSTTWTRLRVKIMYSTLSSSMQKPEKE